MQHHRGRHPHHMASKQTKDAVH
ncbi:hypothetical protein V12B01_12950 [Vibrio splendidus 12B01]|nr:hypothetical protein V12B01_12950 [Vibrio splendidus 12B01]